MRDLNQQNGVIVNCEMSIDVLFGAIFVGCVAKRNVPSCFMIWKASSDCFCKSPCFTTKVIESYIVLENHIGNGQIVDA